MSLPLIQQAAERAPCLHFYVCVPRAHSCIACRRQTAQTYDMAPVLFLPLWKTCIYPSKNNIWSIYLLNMHSQWIIRPLLPQQEQFGDNILGVRVENDDMLRLEFEIIQFSRGKTDT